jgi:hypothetical protein
MDRACLLGCRRPERSGKFRHYTTHFTCLNTIACLFSFYSQQGHVTHSVCNASTYPLFTNLHFGPSNVYFETTVKFPCVHWLISCPNGKVMEYNLWLINSNINYSIVERHSYRVSWTFLGCTFNYTRNPILLQSSPTQTITRRSRWGLQVISAASVVTFLSL